MERCTVTQEWIDGILLQFSGLCLSWVSWANMLEVGAYGFHFAKILLNFQRSLFVDYNLWGPCGFRSRRGAVDICFSVGARFSEFLFIMQLVFVVLTKGLEVLILCPSELYSPVYTTFIGTAHLKLVPWPNFIGVQATKTKAERGYLFYPCRANKSSVV